MDIRYNYEVFPNIPLHFMCEGFDMSKLEETNTSIKSESYGNTLKDSNYVDNNYFYLRNGSYNTYDQTGINLTVQHHSKENEMINVKIEPIEYSADDEVPHEIASPAPKYWPKNQKLHSVKKPIEIKLENRLPGYILKRLDRCINRIGQKSDIVNNAQNLTNAFASFEHLKFIAENSLVSEHARMQQKQEETEKKPFILSYTDAPINLTKKQTRSSAARRSYSKQFEQIENANDLQTIGPNGTQVPRELLEKMEWDDVNSATRKLLMMIFDRTTLATRSLTGKPSPAFVDFANYKVKERLDEQKIKDIIYLVKQRTNALDKHVRQAITTKLADENKMMKQRLKKEQLMLKKQQEAAKAKSSQ